MSTVHHAALAADAAGLAVCPPREDGSKAPDTAPGDGWKRWQAERPPRALVERWYARQPERTGCGYFTGRVSGNLEVLEFDDRATYLAYRAVAQETGLGELVERIESGCLEETPSGGVHWPYRCVTIGGNTKLARRPKRPEEMRDPGDRVKVLIETRGEGGYIVAPPSYGRVHPSGRAYVQARGSVATIATITPEERAALFDLARSFDQMPKPRIVEPPAARATAPAGTRPGDLFAACTPWVDILGPHGWRPVLQLEGVTHWRRPGKDCGASATTNYEGSDLLYVFSSSTVFEPERGYGKFSAYTLLNYGGDYRTAALALAAQGYSGLGALVVRADARAVRVLPSPPRRAGIRLPEPSRPPGVRLAALESAQ